MKQCKQALARAKTISLSPSLPIIPQSHQNLDLVDPFHPPLPICLCSVLLVSKYLRLASVGFFAILPCLCLGRRRRRRARSRTLTLFPASGPLWYAQMRNSSRHHPLEDVDEASSDVLVQCQRCFRVKASLVPRELVLLTSCR